MVKIQKVLIDGKPLSGSIVGKETLFSVKENINVIPEKVSFPFSLWILGSNYF